MAFIAKMFVMILGLGSIGLCTVSAFVYFNRIHWVTDKDKKNVGVIEKSNAQITEYTEASGKAYRHWSGSLSSVQLHENERYPNRTYYSEELRRVVEGTTTAGGPADPAPVKKQLINPTTGFIDKNPARISELVRGKPLQVYSTYAKEIDTANQAILDSQKLNEQAINDRKKLTDEIVGVDVPTKIKGLRLKIAEQQKIALSAQAEDRFIYPSLTNFQAEFGLIDKRQKAMQLRMTELGKTTKANDK